jgi:hypothetical protein
MIMHGTFFYMSIIWCVIDPSFGDFNPMMMRRRRLQAGLRVLTLVAFIRRRKDRSQHQYRAAVLHPLTLTDWVLLESAVEASCQWAQRAPMPR